MKTFFISSTFKDMQAERDVLHEQVFPRLRTLIKQLGDDVQEVDLRWGVDTVNMTEEESGHEVLRICIDAIDRCKPYMIVLLGERYGWIPGKSIVDSARDQRISDRYEQEMSITELEIQYGALLNDEAFDNCIFCFRDPGVMDQIDTDHLPQYRGESPLHARRLKALKNQIRAKKNAVILDYTAQWDPQRQTLCGLEPFAQAVFQKLEKMIRQDFEEQQALSMMEHRRSEIRMLRDGYLSSYVRRYPEEFWITRHIAAFQRDISIRDGKRGTDCLLVSGGAGSGKTALMAYMSGNLPDMENRSILCIAAASGCRDVPSLKQYIAYSLECILSEPHVDDPASMDQHLRILDKKAEKLGIVCFVDGLDQIYQGQRDPYLDLPAICPSLFWVFSALPEFPFERAAADYRYQTVFVERLLPVQRRELIGRTAQKRGKKLDNQLVDMITGREGASNPLFLSLVLQRLFMMNKAEFEAAEALAPGMEGLHRYMRRLLSEMPDLPEQMAGYILDATAKLFDQEQFAEILMLIACSCGGLTEKELEGLLGLEERRFVPVKFQQIVSYLYDAFDRRSNGKWTFHHRLFGEAVLKLMSGDDRKRIQNLLVDYALSDEEFLRKEGFRYLLAQKHKGFARILEEADAWENEEEISVLVGSSAAVDAGIREFLVQLVRNHPTDAMAAFWLEFEEFRYGGEVETMTAEIIRILLDAPVSAGKKWRLALRHTYDVPKEELLPLLNLAEESAQTLQEPDSTVAEASIQAELARALTALNGSAEAIVAARERSLSAIDRAMASGAGEISWKQRISLLESLRVVLNNASSWEDPAADRLWLHALELVEAVRPASAEQEDELTFQRVQFSYRLCDVHCKRPWRNYEKAKQFGNQAMELAEAAASQRPTARNLKNKYNAIESYTHVLKEEYTWPYRVQLVDCARQMYALNRTEFNKRTLASAEVQCGLAYFYAVKANVERSRLENREEALGNLDRGSALFEELIAADYDKSALGIYAASLVERVELQCDDTEQSLKWGHRALDLIRQRQQELQKQLDAATDDRGREQYRSPLNWCVGWSARAWTAMATLCMDLLELETCLCYAREGLTLSRERAKTASAYYTEVLTCALLIAQSSYCLRRDDEALAACDETTAILDSIGSQGERREPVDAELLYIRSRIALERGEADAAWQYCRECLSRKKTRLLMNRAQILKADCLQALGDPKCDEEWREALRIWREEWKRECKAFHSKAQYIHSLNAVPDAIEIPWRSRSRFTLPAFYMAYCYHHYVTDRERYARDYDVFERKTLAAVYYQGKGRLKGKMPFKMVRNTLPGYSDTPIPDCPDFQSFLDSVHSFVTGGDIDPTVCRVILKNIDKFPDVIPDQEQFNTLDRIVKILYDTQLKERRSFYSEKQECDLLQALFRPEEPFPTCRIGWTGQLEILPRDYAESSSDRWYALLKLLLVMMRRDAVAAKKNFSTLRSVYRVVSDQIGGSEELEKADLRFLTIHELEELRRFYDLEHELRIRVSNVYWYAMKNVWTAELYRRTGDPSHITYRLQELETFLTEPYAQQYRNLESRSKSDMPTEISNAARHFIRALNERAGADMALPVLRWVESVPELSGRMGSRTLYSIQVNRESDQAWLEEMKLHYCKTWLEQRGNTLSSILVV